MPQPTFSTGGSRQVLLRRTKNLHDNSSDFRQPRFVTFRPSFRFLAACIVMAIAAFAFCLQAATRYTLLPRFRDGQELTYRVRYREKRTVRAESRVVAPMAPEGGQVDLIRNVRVEVKAAPGANAFSFFVYVSDADASFNPQAKALGFTLSEKGEVENLTNAAVLGSEEQQIWRSWISRFTVSWALPDKLKAGDKWSGDEPIAGAVLAALSWQKESRFVQEQPCPVQPSAASGRSGQSCAVILSKAAIKQKSSPRDATPEEYRVRDLKTSGSARGTDEAISYVSLGSGLVIRATDDSTQAMDVMIAKADGSNHVRYTVDARSHTEILLVE
jgi:hypothetical protein